MTCQKCGSPRVLSVYAKHNDLYHASINGHEYNGYGIAIDLLGGGDELNFNVCLNCGQIQGQFPVPTLPLEQGILTSVGSLDDIDEDELIELRGVVEERAKQAAEEAEFEAAYFACRK